MKHLFLLLSLIISSLVYSQQNDTFSWLEDFLNDEAVKNAPVSIYAANTLTGETLLKTNAQISITPASVLKLITSATALEKMGAGYRFKTTIGYKGEIVNRTLVGDLIITGGGDPTMGSSYFNNKSQTKEFLSAWAHLIKKNGIDSISGNIVVDPGIYSDSDVPQTWIWEDLGNYFGAAAQGIAIYDNTFNLVFETENSNGGKTQIINTIPFIPNLSIKNEVLASNDTRDRAFVYGSPFDSFRIIKGTLPKGRSKFNIKASIPDPAHLLAHEFKTVLTDSFVIVAGKPFKNIFNDKQDSILFEWTSPALNKIVKQLNYESVNLFAEHLCKHLGYITYNDGSTQAGIKAIKNFWKKKGIDTGNLFLADGSGLSRVNAMSSKTLVEVLQYMHNNSSYFDDYLNSIPLTGLEGTQQYYFKNSILKGKARAKSGSMKRVRSFAGYMTTKRGTPIAYAIIVNNFNCKSFAMAKKMEKLMEGFYLDF